jgi:adenosyl cobinamide kinase/adenosyl cobinamide phosphate guanylyltransferase
VLVQIFEMEPESVQKKIIKTIYQDYVEDGEVSKEELEKVLKHHLNHRLKGWKVLEKWLERAGGCNDCDETKSGYGRHQKKKNT